LYELAADSARSFRQITRAAHADIVANAVGRVWLAGIENGRFRETAHLPAYMHATVRDVALNGDRPKGKSTRNRSLSEQLDPDDDRTLESTIASETLRPDAITGAMESLRAVVTLFNEALVFGRVAERFATMGSAQRNALEKHLSGMSYRDASAALGVKNPNYKMQLARARENLRIGFLQGLLIACARQLSTARAHAKAIHYAFCRVIENMSSDR
jgi:DNA-directed RNA polymerase specialized sigma24 family protein